MVIDKDLNEKVKPLNQDLNEGEKEEEKNVEIDLNQDLNQRKNETEKTVEVDRNQDVNEGIFPNFHIKFFSPILV